MEILISNPLLKVHRHVILARYEGIQYGLECVKSCDLLKTYPGGSSRMSLQTAGVDVTLPRESTTALEPVRSLVSMQTKRIKT